MIFCCKEHYNYQINRSSGYILITCILLMLLMIFIGTLVLQISNSNQLQFELINQRIDKDYAEQGAWEWMEAYVRNNQKCFDTSIINFDYDFYVSCQRQNDDFILKLFQIKKANRVMSPNQVTKSLTL